MVAKVARAESGITTRCSLSALCSKPCGKGHWPPSLVLAVAVPQGSRSTEGGGLGTNVSPRAVKRKNKPHRISVLAKREALLPHLVT